MSVEFDQSSKDPLIPMLRACPALKDLISRHNLTDATLRGIIEPVQLRSYKLGEYVTLKPNKANKQEKETEPPANQSKATDSGNFFFVAYGQVKKVNDQNTLLAYYEQLDLFGEFDAPYTITTEITSSEAILAIFDGEAIKRLIDQIPGAETELGQIEIRHKDDKRLEFEGIEPDEVVIRKDKRHILALVAKLTEPLAVILLGLLVSWLLEQFSIATDAVPFIFGAFVLVAIGWIIYNVVDWANDDFIITTKRVVHIERTIIYGETRDEAPLGAIQDVKVSIPNLFTRIFNYRNIVIQTAGVGNVIFDGLGNGDQIRRAIFAQKKSAAQRVEATNTTAIRSALNNRIYKKISLADIWKPEEAPPKKPTWLDKVLAWRPRQAINYLIPKMKEVNGDTITWRKHYLILLRDATIPALATMFSFYLLVAAFWGLPPFQEPHLRVTMLLLVIWVGTIFWYIYQYDTWQKDIYIVTNDNIIDIKGSPLNLGAEMRREGSFANVQNITYRTPSFFTRFFNMGNVVIETAGTMDTFTFEQVFNYKQVQQEISKRLFAYKRREREKTRADEEQRFTHWLGEFHDITQPTPPPVAPS